MALNACRHCQHTWHPRGAPLSAKCPRCGKSDGVELAVVQTTTGAESTISEARRDGYNQKTSQVRWALLALAVIIVLVVLFGGVGGAALWAGTSTSGAGGVQRPATSAHRP